jgi:hypothetical protein
MLSLNNDRYLSTISILEKLLGTEQIAYEIEKLFNDYNFFSLYYRIVY